MYVAMVQDDQETLLNKFERREDVQSLFHRIDG